MSKYEGILSAVKQGIPFFQMISSGIKPDEIKTAIIELLDKYFENKEILKKYAVEKLVPESINLMRLQENEHTLYLFEKCLASYRLAKQKNHKACFESFALWNPQILQSVSTFWSILHLEVDKNLLELEEFVQECFRNIGGAIEGVMKPRIKLHLHQVRIADGEEPIFEEINLLDLGKGGCPIAC
ncbi:hypothetical protein JXM67_11855 [candidate division WOR-3 bacterium]|nr:hypothetical protein [candidate division WOR-3 bacterium]